MYTSKLAAAYHFSTQRFGEHEWLMKRATLPLTALSTISLWLSCMKYMCVEWQSAASRFRA